MLKQDIKKMVTYWTCIESTPESSRGGNTTRDTSEWTDSYQRADRILNPIRQDEGILLHVVVHPHCFTSKKTTKNVSFWVPNTQHQLYCAYIHSIFNGFHWWPQAMAINKLLIVVLYRIVQSFIHNVWILIQHSNAVFFFLLYVYLFCLNPVFLHSCR